MLEAVIRTLVLLAPTLLGLPQLFPGALVSIIVVCIFVAAGLLVAASRSRFVALRGHAALALLFFGLVVLACVRSQAWGPALTWTSFLLFAAAVLLADVDADRTKRLRTAIVASPAVFVAVNVVLAALGFVSEQSASFAYPGDATILSAIGIRGVRQLFPLAFGFGDFGVAAGLGLVGSLMLLRGATTMKARAVLGGSTLLCLYGLLAVDTRGTMVAALAAVVLVVVFARNVGRPLSLVAAAIPVGPILVILAIGAFANSEVVSTVSRGGDIPTATGRILAWEVIVDHLGEHSVQDLVGYGAFGPSNAGVSERYEFFLPPETSAHFGTAHSFGLQMVLDVGYLGLLLVVLLVAGTIGRLAAVVRATGSKASEAMLAMMLLLVVAGFTDTTPTIYSPQAFAVWIMIILATLRPQLREGRACAPAAPLSASRPVHA